MNEYEIFKMRLDKILLSLKHKYITIFLGSIWNIPYISIYGVSFSPLINSFVFLFILVNNIKY